MNNFPILVEDKKYCKDIQESTHKLFELCNSIVASSLQQTTWLRKNYAVKLLPSSSSPANSNTLNMTGGQITANTSAASTPTSFASSNNNMPGVVTAGGGPGMGGAILVQNDTLSLSSSKTNATSSGYGGSANMTNSMNSSVVSSVVNGAQKPTNNGIGDLKFSNNNSSFSDIENGKFFQSKIEYFFCYELRETP